MDGRTTLFYKDGWTDDVVLYAWVGGQATLFYKDGWMDGRRCFIRIGGWTDAVVL